MRTLDLVSDAAKARVRARYRAEARFKFYGLAAIGLTAIFLVVVLADIVVRGLPAFWQHKLQLDVMVDRAEIDPQGTRDPAVIRAGDFQALVRNSLRAQFPEVSDRAGRRLLDGILSSGASDVAARTCRCRPGARRADGQGAGADIGRCRPLLQRHRDADRAPSRAAES